ncbi:MAG: preprotein translocase subunit SecE [Nitrospirae bacterium]|nr:preprotein translocase subunit SecE [Nitrospirota bacterium]
MESVKKIIESIKTFFLEVRAETKKVSFPAKDETIGTTAVVLVLVSIATIYMWILDVALSEMIARILP